MSELLIRFRNAHRAPLDDRLEVRVTRAATNAVLAHQSDLSGRHVLKVSGVEPGDVCIVTGYPRRHRPVGQVVLVPASGRGEAQMFFPLHPDHGRATFPAYADLAPELRQVLDRSTLEGATDSGAALYAGLIPVDRAGLLNLFCKMRLFGFDDRHTAWSGVERVYRVRPDRIFADVDISLRDRVRSAEADGRVRKVSGRLHTPPPGFSSAGSFKTDDRHGNLQLTFFASDTPPLRFKVDADIDDANGLAHTFQVLRNWIRDDTTHPYDIHQILAFRQEAVPDYVLA